MARFARPERSGSSCVSPRLTALGLTTLGFATLGFATLAGTTRRIAFTSGDACQSRLKLGTQLRKITFNAAFATDQHMVGTGHALMWQNITQQRAKAPFHAIARHRIADLACNGHAKARPIRYSATGSDSIAGGNGAIGNKARLYQQHKAGSCDPDPMVCSNKIRPLADNGQRQRPGQWRIGFGVAVTRHSRPRPLLRQADSFFRPRARRARRMLRPPTVAVRARKPWRRARTRRLG